MRSHRRRGELVRIRSGRRAPDRGGDLLAQLKRGRDAAVAVPLEELDLLDAERGGGGALFRLPDQRHLVAWRGVETARVAARHQQVGHLDTRVDPGGHRAAGAEIHVVGVCENAKDPLHIRQRVH